MARLRAELDELRRQYGAQSRAAEAQQHQQQQGTAAEVSRLQELVHSKQAALVELQQRLAAAESKHKQVNSRAETEHTAGFLSTVSCVAHTQLMRERTRVPVDQRGPALGRAGLSLQRLLNLEQVVRSVFLLPCTCPLLELLYVGKSCSRALRMQLINCRSCVKGLLLRFRTRRHCLPGMQVEQSLREQAQSKGIALVDAEKRFKQLESVMRRLAAKKQQALQQGSTEHFLIGTRVV